MCDVVNRAEDLAAAAPSLDMLIKAKQSSFKKILRSKFHEKRSRSILSLNQFKEDSTLSKLTIVCFNRNLKPISFRQSQLLET